MPIDHNHAIVLDVYSNVGLDGINMLFDAILVVIGVGNRIRRERQDQPKCHPIEHWTHPIDAAIPDSFA